MRIFILLTFLNIQLAKSQNDTLIYIGDPMCSWCYGFGPELDKIIKAFPNTPFEIIMGGLRPEGRETIGDLKEFLWNHWKEVQIRSGQKFNFSILNKEEMFYDTEPACRAVVIMRRLNHDCAYDFYKAAQHSFFYENIDPLEGETYARLAKDFGVDEEIFLDLFNDEQSKADTYSDFSLAEAMGIHSFPTLIAKIDNKLYLVSNGFQNAEQLILRLKAKGLQ